MHLKKVGVETPLPLFYIGPNLDQGPLPAIFYFALSAKETLTTNPFNEPISHFTNLPARIFSVDLPFHGENLSSVKAMHHWALSIAQEENTLSSFLSELEESISILLSLNIFEKKRIASIGLSRGAFIAMHMAAKFHEIDTLLLYAPLTRLERIKEFADIPSSPILTSLDINNLIPALSNKAIRAHIGGRDTRVSTDACYHWIRSLIEDAHANNRKFPPIELIIKPSIGYQGHGTSTETFKEGALWLLEKFHPREPHESL